MRVIESALRVASQLIGIVILYLGLVYALYYTWDINLYLNCLYFTWDIAYALQFPMDLDRNPTNISRSIKYSVSMSMAL